MPTYEYECEKCKHRFEKFLPINNTVENRCPVCGSKTRRLISGGSGLIFKGNGFYITDYKKSHASPNPQNQNEIKKEKPDKKSSDG